MDELRRVRPALAAQLEARNRATPAARSGWSAATPRDVRWSTGRVVRLPSKTEARVAERLLAEVAATPGARLYRQVPLWLPSIAPNDRGVPYVLRVDFAVVVPGAAPRYVEAKTKRRSREWARGVAAARAAGYAIEETDR